MKAPAPARLFRYHKPAGVLTAERDPQGRPTIYDRMPKDLPRLMPVGRLDLNTEGLLLLTSDGGLKRQLELPSSGVERVYRARTFGEISQEQLETLIHGIEIEGIRYGPIDANLERRTGRNQWIEVKITEGKNREVRRVLEYLGLQVSRLIRVAYGPFALGDLPAGQVDEIRQHDLVIFRKDLTGAQPSALRAAVDRPVHASPRPKPVARPHDGRPSARPAPDRSDRQRARVAGSGPARPAGGDVHDRSGDSPRRGRPSSPAGPGADRAQRHERTPRVLTQRPTRRREEAEGERPEREPRRTTRPATDRPANTNGRRERGSPSGEKRTASRNDTAANRTERGRSREGSAKPPRAGGARQERGPGREGPPPPPRAGGARPERGPGRDGAPRPPRAGGARPERGPDRDGPPRPPRPGGSSTRGRGGRSKRF